MGASHAKAYHDMSEFEIIGLVSRGDSKNELQKKLQSDYPLFETIWRDMVDLYDFIAASEDDDMLESELGTMEVES